MDRVIRQLTDWSRVRVPSPAQMSFYVYILKSEIVEKFYIGFTSDLDRRIKLHNSPRARWTKKYQPWVLIHSEEYESRAEAVRRERALKSFKGIRDKLPLIQNRDITVG